MSVTGNGSVQISGRDVASFFFNTRKGLSRFVGAVYWLFRWKVTVPESALVKCIWPMRDADFIKSYLKSRKITLAGSCRYRALSKQRYVNSCGAQCLRQIAYELGIKTLPKNRFYKFDGQSIEDDSTEAAIYGVAGRLVDERGSLKTRLDDGGGSDPIGINNAAVILGLDSRLYCSSRMTDWHLRQSDPSRWKEIKSRCSVHRSSPPQLCNNERLIVLVSNDSLGSFIFNSQGVKRHHYIMQRPDGSCYDPYDGKKYISVEAYSASSEMKPNGIYILVSDRQSYAKAPCAKLSVSRVSEVAGAFSSG
ncbi:hypothetical protein [Endozoicomonas elysicola]|uniref:Uncharacterized protein n=1 Tax=Endozoicomonas elysicola TaxID=305900 RepID=A0A081KED8_9GAMM|nr:hypothetical protein [Endozoicomonas elysicola]KEI72514.1 hypothetical protein GV64_18860 [Endozoicomonas elysicola]